MVVAKAAEKTLDHAVLKIGWGFKFRDSTSMTNHKPEMASLPGDFLVQADKSGGDASKGAFPGPICRRHVQVDAAGKVKDTLDGSFD